MRGLPGRHAILWSALNGAAVALLTTCQCHPATGSGGGPSTPERIGRTSSPVQGSGSPNLASCEPLPPPSGSVVTVSPRQAGQLPRIVRRARQGETILLEDGTYDLDGGTLHFGTPGVTLRSRSGDRDAVVLDGRYATSEIVLVTASEVTIAEVTLARALHHPIHISPGDDGDIDGVRVYGVRIVDPGQQAIKVNQSPDESQFVDRGEVACSVIELTDAGRERVLEINGSCYTGGLDIHMARDWVVRDNHFEGFYCTRDLSEHAIHFWKGCRGSLVERNVIVDSARGIGFGMAAGGSGRRYQDLTSRGAPRADHYGGMVRNNVIVTQSADLFASESGADCGICMWSAQNASVVHNTVVAFGGEAFSSIEWRFPETSVNVWNNLVSHQLLPRDGASAQSGGNRDDATTSFFVDTSAERFDGHLRSATPAVNGGGVLEAGTCDRDMDGQLRDDHPDVGADEHGSP